MKLERGQHRGKAGGCLGFTLAMASVLLSALAGIAYTLMGH